MTVCVCVGSQYYSVRRVTKCGRDRSDQTNIWQAYLSADFFQTDHSWKQYGNYSLGTTTGALVKYSSRGNEALQFKKKKFFCVKAPPQLVRASSFTRFLDHTQRRATVGRTPLDEWSNRRRDLYLTTHNAHNRHPCPSVGFEPTISTGERPQIYVSARAATGTGPSLLHFVSRSILTLCVLAPVCIKCRP